MVSSLQDKIRPSLESQNLPEMEHQFPGTLILTPYPFPLCSFPGFKLNVLPVVRHTRT